MIMILIIIIINRRETHSADRDQRGRTSTSSVAARIQETTKALQGSVREEASSRKEQVLSHKSRILRDINENTSSLKAAWNRNIRGTLRINNNRQRLLDEVKIYAGENICRWIFFQLRSTADGWALPYQRRYNPTNVHDWGWLVGRHDGLASWWRKAGHHWDLSSQLCQVHPTEKSRISISLGSINVIFCWKMLK